MVALLLSLALLFGAYEGTCETVESTPMQIESVVDEQINDVALPELAVAFRTLRAHHREASQRPAPELGRVFRPPRS
jgi:hypothetical protein